MSAVISELVARVRAIYAGCAAYQDSGVVTTVFLRDRPKQVSSTVTKPFRTAFVRPDRFRFEFAQEGVRRWNEQQRLTVVWNELGVRSNWTVKPGVETHASIGAPLVAANGVSGGSARNVVGLLLPGVETGDPLANAEHGELLRAASEDGRECHVLRYSPDVAQPPRTVWIDAREFLIRRVDDTQVFDAAWYEAQRARHAELLKGDLSEEQRAMLEHMLAQSPGSQQPFRTETTTHCKPSLDAPDASVFATPAEWATDTKSA